LATGAEAKIPFKVRSNVEGLFTVRNLDDALALTGWLEGERPAEAAVIGAGIQGLEWVDALLRRGLRVTLIERRTEVATRCDRAIGALVRERLGGRGVRVMTGAAVEGIKTGSGRAIRALATDGGKIECGVAVVACGVAPRVELALTAGIILDPCGAIAVDGTMQTNVTGIYAAGDCICVPHLVTGSPYYQPTGALAVKTGRIAGTNAAGKYAAFSGALGTQAVVAVDYELGVTGLNLAEAELLRLRPVAVTVRAPERARYIGAGDLTVHLVGDAGSGRLIGAQLFGARGVVGRLGTLTAAISARLPIEELAMLDLPYAPKASPVWDPLHIAAGELLKKLKS
jgi:pyruvate/2-oxoglutarate dehydrogenase complex dihydrolipoamide dehydrogenase (E3) component